MSRFSALLTIVASIGLTTQLIAACSVGEVPLNGGGDDTPGPDAGSGSGSQNLTCPPRAGTPAAAFQHGAGTNVPADNPTAKGTNCMACHTGGTAPAFSSAGTVYKPDKVTPQAGVTVRLIPGNGGPVLTATTDDAGNFVFKNINAAATFPATTDACFDTKQALMQGIINSPAEGACNSGGCHQEPGGTYGAIKLAD